MKLTKQDIIDTAGLSSREAAKRLGCGKTTVNKYRAKYGADKPEARQVKPGGSPAGTYTEDGILVNANGLPIVPEYAPEASLTSETIEDDLAAVGATESSHRLSYSFSEWDMADGTKGRSRKVTAVPIQAELTEELVDPLELLAKAREQSTKFEQHTIGRTSCASFVISFNDWQFGKKTLQGSTADTIRIVTASIEAAKLRIRNLNMMGYEFDELIVIFGGDIIEGCANTPQGAFGIEMGQRQQIEGAVALGLTAIDELAPAFPKVQVLAVRGNHGENRINNGRATTPEDNNDTLIAAMIRSATERDPALQHVEYVIADDHAGVWTTTATGWKLGTTHGDVYGKGVSGATTERKVNTWYKNMAAGRDPLGQVDVMITHHYHHSQSADYGTWEWHQTPAQDGALSEYFRQVSGNFSKPGVLTFVMGEERYMEEKVV